MAKSANNKFPTDKAGTKYSEFRNTKRVASGKVKSDKDAKQAVATQEQGAGKKA
jgi:hypothetical protein